MVGNSGDGGSDLGSAQGGLPGEPEGSSTPVLGGVSDAELDAFVSKLRTDKNRIAAPATQSRSRGEMLGERLHRGRPLVSSVQEAAVSHDWYVALGAKPSGPHDLTALKGFCERGELGPDSLCWRDGFSAWLPLCQVPELAEALVPLPRERVPTADEVPVGGGAPDFEPKGAEALRSLSAEPVTASLDAAGALGTSTVVATQGPVEGLAAARSGSVDPAWTQASTAMHEQGAGSLQGGTPVGGVGTHAPANMSESGAGLLSVGGASVDPAGTHAVLGAAPANRGETRWRRAVGLALLGGATGGVTVAVLLGLLGNGQGSVLFGRLRGGDAVNAAASASATPGGAGGSTPSASATPGSAGGAAPSVSATPGSVGAAAASAATLPGNGVPVSASADSAPGTVGTAASAATVTGNGVPGSASAGLAPGAVGTGAGQEVPGNAMAAPGTGSTVGTVKGATAASGAVAGAPAGAAGSGAVAGSSLAPLGNVGLERGGSVPLLATTGGKAVTTPSAPAASLASSLTTASPPVRAPVARPSAPAAALALESRPAGPPPVDDASPDAEQVEAVPAAKESPASELGPDEAFERELSEPPAKDVQERTVYVPPDPAKPAASLAQSDIFEVVLANKGDINACAAAQQPQTPSSGGRVVVRWSILPSGKVGEVVTETASLQGTPIARCIEGKVRAWTFPKHEEQGGPVRFPFVF
ncbi:AgmX/PglI C-terminal domain-containing protein [Pyxidicoccus trucidator]|uniref:AgmX/PglI C-terminal domain-containing protein n=1 Tax=Pyxidicoccus trucidator TaxID=2709662 RepID=UPI0013DA6681|nr:AgmX/PglI C-terminal domain-containing protein [Pyxidicoccus trucidator]